MNKTIVFVFIFMFIVNFINAEKFGICSCFHPDYDGSCCIVAKGTMNENVCEVPNLKYVPKYEKCCNKINGKIKCKTGYRD
jgi:hypothetical protein